MAAMHMIECTSNTNDVEMEEVALADILLLNFSYERRTLLLEPSGIDLLLNFLIALLNYTHCRS